MKHAPEILAELVTLSPVVSKISKGNIFKVPDNYFLNFSENLLSNLADTGNLPSKEIITQKVPEGYFENLAASILNKIKETSIVSVMEEMEMLSPVIAGIGRGNIFKVPDGYFEKAVITGQTVRQPAKVVSGNFRKRILQYAAAAVVTFLIGLALFTYNNTNTSVENNVAQIKQTEAVMAQAKQIISEDSFDEILNELPEGEIEKYLTQRGLDVQAALVASSIESSNLPSAEEYLFNENALADFLKEQNIPN